LNQSSHTAPSGLTRGPVELRSWALPGRG
jgi:hypothetical protein